MHGVNGSADMGGEAHDLGLARTPAMQPRVSQLDRAAEGASDAVSQWVPRVDGAARVAG